MKRILMFLIAFSLVGCNPIETFEEMSQKQNEFNQLSLKELGVEAFVGWNVYNGKLNTVTIMYPQGTLQQLTVGELEKKTFKMVRSVFKEEPNMVTYGFQMVNK